MKNYAWLVFPIIFILFSCKKDKLQFDAGSNEVINQWIWKTMDSYYFWKVNSNAKTNLIDNPMVYYKKLLNQNDRFSSIVQNRNLESYNNSFETSFGFDFIQVKKNNEIISIINLVVPGSQADELGLKRGDTLSTINQIRMDRDISSLAEQILKSNSITLKRIDGHEFQIASAFIAQPIIYKSTIINSGSKKFGYLYLSHFNFAGANDIIREIQKFKNENIHELILDLRYNPGGQVSFSAFCALLFSKVDPEDNYIQLIGNSKVGKKEYTFSKSLSEQPDGYSFKSQELKSNSLNKSRIYILTSRQTASSSELMINNLKPYIEVIQIGETSMGKDMGSINFSSPEEVSGKSNYKWILFPLVYKLYNSQGKGDYSNGLTAQISVNELNNKKLYPLGDIQDPLINAAIHNNIKTKSTTKQSISPNVIYRSERHLEMMFEEND